MRLILLRHAKSSWDSAAPTDHQRPLNKRGQRDAPKISSALVQRGWIPDVVLCSDAIRARETFERMTEAFPKAQLEICPDLYHAGWDELATRLASLPADAKTVLAVGHNPGWEEALHRIASTDEPMTTCNAALLESAASTWQDAAAQDATFRLVELIRPRELKKAAKRARASAFPPQR